MNTERLRYFIEAYRCLNMVKAADAIGISHQGLSRSIKQLEGDLNVVLFQRTSRGISPTPAAVELYEHALAIVSIEDRMKMVAEGYRRREQHAIAVGLGGDNLFSHMVGSAIDEYAAVHDDVSITVEHFQPYNPQEMLDAVTNGQLDFIWVFHRKNLPGFAYHPIRTVDLGVLVGESSPLRDREIVGWGDISDNHVILPSATDGYTHNVREFLASVGCPLDEDRCVYATDTQSIALLLSASNVVGVASRGFVDVFHSIYPGARLIPAEPRFDITVSFLSRDDGALSPEKRQLVDYLCERFAAGARGFF